MGFLSYAQNFEDVMLWRALGHVEGGVYVDIGAQHPRIDSISRAFYERGWRGVHIEPVPAFAEMLRQDRPDEIVLQVALGEREGTLELNVFADTGLSTAIQDYAVRHQAERGYAVERIHVPMLTVRSALDLLAGKQVHWLKIDVEGFEQHVLRGWDSQKLRPWVIVVEATIPNSTETDYEKWEPLVIEAGYRFVYFDGLNRFYIANEHPELAEAFSAPPNIFDAVEVSGQASWGLCNFAVAEYRSQIDTLTAQHAHEVEQSNASKAELESTKAELDATKAALETTKAEFTAAEAEFRATEAGLKATEAGLRATEAGLKAAEAELKATEVALKGNVAALEGTVTTLEGTVVALEGTVADLERQLAAATEQAATATAKAEELKHTAYYWWHSAEELRRHVNALNEQLGQVYVSTSWRLTGPLRFVGARTMGQREFAGRVIRWTRRQAGRVKRKLVGQGKTMGIIQTAKSPDVVVLSQAGASGATRRLSPRAARLYADLKQVVEGKTE